MNVSKKLYHFKIAVVLSTLETPIIRKDYYCLWNRLRNKIPLSFWIRPPYILNLICSKVKPVCRVSWVENNLSITQMKVPFRLQNQQGPQIIFLLCLI